MTKIDSNSCTKKDISTMDKTDILTELINKQLNNIEPTKLLQYCDLKRICKYINTSIFDEDVCCIWNGYVTNSNSSIKGTYVNFYFKKKKAALHRLLYINYIDNLQSDEYLKFNCDNGGNCCNISHFKKFKYKKKCGRGIIEDKNKYKNDKLITIITCDDTNKDILTVKFY